MPRCELKREIFDGSLDESNEVEFFIITTLAKQTLDKAPAQRVLALRFDPTAAATL